MAQNQALLFLALSISVTALVLFDPLINFSNHNPNASLHFIAVHIFLFFVIPSTFTSAIILLLLLVAMPQSAFFINHLTTATRVLVSATLLLGTPPMVHVAFAEAVTPDPLMVVYIGVVVVAAVQAAYKFNLFKRYFRSASQTARSFVPAFVAVCLSTSTFLFIDPLLSFSSQDHKNTLAPVPIQLLLLALNFLNFLLAIGMLFLRIIVPTHGPQIAKPAVLIEYLVEAMLAMSFTVVLIGLCMMVVPFGWDCVSL